jgi:hypothetical protein
MVAFVALLKLGGVLAGLGLVTAMTGALLVSGLLQTDDLRYFLCVVYLLLGISLAFLSYWRNAIVLSRVMLIILTFLDITSAITVPIVKYDFFDDAGFLNRSVYCLFLLIAFLGSLATFWHYVTGLLASDYLEQAGIDSAQQTFLYFVWALIVAFTECWFVTLDPVYNRHQYFLHAVRDTCGFWIFGAVAAGLLGVLILHLGGGDAAISHKAITPVDANEPTYDTVG